VKSVMPFRVAAFRAPLARLGVGTGLLVGTVLLASTVLLAGTATAQVSVDQVFPAPPNGVYTFDGHGFGHGRGLNQWGAQGAASSGVSVDAILAAYYPGTTLAGDGGDPKIRVHLLEPGPSALEVVAATGLLATDAHTGNRYPLPTTIGTTHVPFWEITLDAARQQCLDWFDGSKWNSCWTPTGATTNHFTGPFVLTNTDTGVLRQVWSPANTLHDFRGNLTAVQPGFAPATIATVNTLPLESYVDGVVPREAISSWDPAALEAQAVAARSYALYHVLISPDYTDWDICDTTACQVYGGKEVYDSAGNPQYGEEPSTNAATAATNGQILEQTGKVIFAEYSSSNGGWSVAGNHPYEQAHADPWDAIASPYHAWQRTVTVAQIEADYPSIGQLRDLTVTSRDGNGDWGGRVLGMRLDGSKGSLDVDGGSFAFAAGLLTNWWNVDSATYPSQLQPGSTLAAVWTGSQALTLVGLDTYGGATAIGWSDPGGWSTPDRLGGKVTGSPAVGAIQGGPLFSVEGPGGALFARAMSGGWQSLGGNLTSSPASTGWGGDRISVFVRGPDGALYERTRNGSTWSRWYSLAGQLAPGTGAAAVSTGPDRVSVFVHGPHDVIWERDFTTAGWGPYVDLRAPVTGTPGAASRGDGTVTVFARQSNGTLSTATGVPGNPGRWISLGGSLSSDPAGAAPAGGNRTDVFVWGPGNAVFQRTLTGPGWQPWREVQLP